MPHGPAPQLVSKGVLRSFSGRDGQTSVFTAELVDEQVCRRRVFCYLPF